MTAPTRQIHRIRLAAGLAVLLLLLTAASATAAPSFEAGLTHTPETLQRNDEWLAYVLKVKNTASEAPLNVGAQLTCNGTPPVRTWTGTPSTGAPPLSFTYQWMRNGAAIPGATSSSYTLVAEDAEKAIQCVITGKVEVTVKTPKSLVAVSHSVASQPPVVVNPQPATAPPAPSSATVTAARPSVSGTGETAKRTCTAPTNWTAGTSFAFQWLRNGTPIAGATTNEYTPGASDKNVNLQCQVAGSNAGGAAVGISLNSFTGTIESPGSACGGECGVLPSNATNQTPGVPNPNATVGAVKVELELPSGSETEALSNSGTWTCSRTPASGPVHARLVCERFDSLAPLASYPTLEVPVGIGADAPEPTVEAVATVSGGGAATASGVDSFSWLPAVPFGLRPGVFATKVADQIGVDYTQAGGHPTSASETFAFNYHRARSGNIRVTGRVKNANTDTPAGFVGNALASPELCGSVTEVKENSCPIRSMVGGIDIYLGGGTSGEFTTDPYPAKPTIPNLPIYALDPEFGQPVQFAFAIGVLGNVYVFQPRLRAEEGYALSLDPAPIVKSPAILGVHPTLCGFGGKRVGAGADDAGNLFGARFAGCKAPTDADANPIPLISNPTRCAGPPPTTKLVVNSWEHPDDITSDTFAAPPITGCEAVEFEPEAQLTPTNNEADSPTGLEVEFEMPTDGLVSNTGVSQANLDTATVTLPKGMAINPASADGLGGCSLAQVKLKSNAPDECPESSKVGTIEIDTPLIRETLTGNVYVARQNDNPFKTTLGLYMVFSSERDGVRIKVAGKVVPDPVTGQLVSTFTENPEAPFSRLALKFKSGPRAPLVNPPKCGTYAIHSEFSPWSAVNPANPTPEEIVSQDSTYEVTSGPNGSPCPTGALQPKLKAGLQVAKAGAKSPFVFSLGREDGTQRFNKIDVTTPKGLTAYLKGIPYCSDATLAGISEAEETGREQLEHPSCPAASQVGTSQAGAGSGPFPFYAPGKVYLAGPYKGAPVSLAVVTPAVAGPFDLGNVVVRNPLYVDPVTSQVKTESDPIPTILHGLLLDVRDIRVALDRPDFTQAPTNCEPMAVDAHVSGQEGGEANLSNPFQVGDCAALGFKPALSLRLFGGTHRSAHPRLRAVLTPRAGDANIAAASVALPHSEFLDQGHIRTVCTRTQFAAHECPQGSIYGEAEATTPLLDSPLRGPVYLRSSSNPLPDLVAQLRGPDSQPIEVHVDGRIDSVNGGIRSSFDVVPDQPVSSFVLNMQGGKKGLLVNSTDICLKTNRATAKFTAQNGRQATLKPKMQNACKHKPANKHRRHKRPNAR